MEEYFPVYFQKPCHLFVRETADKRINNLEFAVCKSLYSIVTDAILHTQLVGERGVASFIILISYIRPMMRADLVINQVLFQSVMAQMSIRPDETWSLFIIIFDLLMRTVDTPNPLDKLAHKIPLTSKDLMLGLAYCYFSRAVKPNEYESPSLNYHFHYLASSMYALDVVDDPMFFICAMRDALETSWPQVQHLDGLINSVGQWIIPCGTKILRQMKDGYKSSAAPSLLEHGELYKLVLDQTCRGRHPPSGLTRHRWNFWQQRINDTMIFVVECERPPWFKGDDNVARRTAQKMAQLLWEEEAEGPESKEIKKAEKNGESLSG